MAHNVQEHGYQPLPRLGSASHPEEGLEISEVGGDATVPQKPPGSAPSSPRAPDPSASDAPTATAASTAAPPISELELHRARKLMDWTLALFLCTSLVHFVVRLTVTAGLCLCIGIAAASTHLWWRIQGNNSAEALRAAMNLLSTMLALLMFVTPVVVFFQAAVQCDGTETCPFGPVDIIVTVVYILSGFTSSVVVAARCEKLFPTPDPDVVLRLEMQEFAPLSAQAQKALEIRRAMPLLVTEEMTAMYKFRSAREAGNRVGQYEAHRQWLEAGEKLKKLKEELRQLDVQQDGTPTVTV